MACFNRAHAQQRGPALIPAGEKLGVTSEAVRRLTTQKRTFEAIDEAADEQPFASLAVWLGQLTA